MQRCISTEFDLQKDLVTGLWHLRRHRAAAPPWLARFGRCKAEARVRRAKHDPAFDEYAGQRVPVEDGQGRRTRSIPVTLSDSCECARTVVGVPSFSGWRRRRSRSRSDWVSHHGFGPAVPVFPYWEGAGHRRGSHPVPYRPPHSHQRSVGSDHPRPGRHRCSEVHLRAAVADTPYDDLDVVNSRSL